MREIASLEGGLSLGGVAVSFGNEAGGEGIGAGGGGSSAGALVLPLRCPGSLLQVGLLLAARELAGERATRRSFGSDGQTGRSESEDEPCCQQAPDLGGTFL